MAFGFRLTAIAVVVAVAVSFIYDHAEENAPVAIEKDAAAGLVSQYTRPFDIYALHNPGKYYDLTGEALQRVETQINDIIDSRQEVLCCVYEVHPSETSCNGLWMWKDNMPLSLEEMKSAHPKNTLIYLGSKAVTSCPQTQEEAWAITGWKGFVRLH